MGGKKDKLVNKDGSKIPDTNDGVMDDPHRQVPKQGTTGTEGGVSEKDKVRKEKEVKTGEKVEKTPDSPKLAPPLSVGGKNSKVDKTKLKEVQVEDEDEGEGLSGLEVCLYHPAQNYTNGCRNQMTSHPNQANHHILSRNQPTRIIWTSKDQVPNSNH